MISQGFLEALLGEKTPPPPSLKLATPPQKKPQSDRSARTTGPPPQLYSIPPPKHKVLQETLLVHMGRLAFRMGIYVLIIAC